MSYLCFILRWVDLRKLAGILSPLGSLRAADALWEELGFQLGQWWLGATSDMDRVRDVAEAIIRGAVPVEGDPHPRRATYICDESRSWLTFTTPGGVSVKLTEAVEEKMALQVEIQFGRNSANLALSLLTRASEEGHLIAPFLEKGIEKILKTLLRTRHS